MSTQHSLQYQTVREPRDLRRALRLLPRPGWPYASRHALVSLLVLFELVVAAALVGAAWSPRSVTLGTGSYTRQGPLPPPAPNSSSADWRRYAQSQVWTRTATVPDVQSIRVTTRASTAPTPAAIPGRSVPVPAPAPTPTRSVQHVFSTR